MILMKSSSGRAVIRRTALVLSFLAAGALSHAWATDTGAPPAASPEGTARDRAEEWVRAQGWREGPNPDGTVVVIGTAPYDPRTSRLQLALGLSSELACLDARNELATFLAASIAAESGTRLRESRGPAASAIDRIAPGAGADSTSTFRDAVWVSARCELSALLPVARFIDARAGEPGVVAVVMRHDPSSADAAWATAIGARIDAPPGVPEADRWIAALTADEAMGSVGPRLLKDRDGRLIVAAFGHSDVLDEPLAHAKAEERAKIAAEASLRNFIGQVQSGQAVLERASTLSELAGLRASFASAESMNRWMESSAGKARLPKGLVAKTWVSPVTAQGRSVGILLVMRPEADLDARGPAAVTVDGTMVHGSASGSGTFVARTDSDRSLHPALRRTRALRAAVVNAKAELARSAERIIATSVSGRSDDAQVEVRERTVVTVQRALLARAVLVRAEYAGTEDSPECRAWIESTARTRPTPDEMNACGLPVFATEQVAADAIAGWALRGLCDQTSVRVLVGPPGGLRLVDFGVGLGSGDAGGRIASAKALASLSASVSETIDGNDELTRGMTIEDPLGRDGGRMFLDEALITSRRRTSESHVRTGGSATAVGEDGLIAMVVWPASGG